MKHASYRHAIAWIASNDSGGEDDALTPATVGYYVTSLLVADIFGVEPERVGADIVSYRKKMPEFADRVQREREKNDRSPDC
jgi:hypothetical protein